MGAGFLLLAVFVACGGVNTSDKRRAGERTAAAPDDDSDSDDDRDAGDGQLEETTQPASSTPAPADAGTTADAMDPVPAGSFAAGTELETTANLNLRDGPGTDFAVLLTIPQATRVKVKTTSGADGWVHLDHQGTVGYASKMYLKEP